MFEIFFLGLIAPVMTGIGWALIELAQARPFPVIHERRQPWPNPFL